MHQRNLFFLFSHNRYLSLFLLLLLRHDSKKMASQETRPEKTTQVNADSLAFYREKLNDSLQEIQSKVQQWREYEADYEQLREGLERLPDETSHQIMVPVGPLAFFPGKLVKTNELMVLLGENWFVERSAAQAVEIIDRRIEMVQQQLNEATRQSTDLQTRLQLSNGLGDLTGYPLNEEGQPVVEIREEYHSDEEKQVPATISASKKTPSPKSSDNTVDEQGGGGRGD
ncbi:Prefoldin [Syncephalis plumigaleata]|nr:Prefoldin [Syncephalis plumigaleata]